MGYRTNPDRILENIDRERDRDGRENVGEVVRQAVGKDLNTDAPEGGAAHEERLTRVFKGIEKAYMNAAQSADLRKVASRFQAIGDVHHHHARGEVTVTLDYLDHDRGEDIAVIPYEIRPSVVEELEKETKTSRPDVNALKALRQELRSCVLKAFKRLEPRIRDSIRAGADEGHVAAKVALDLRPAK